MCLLATFCSRKLTQRPRTDNGWVHALGVSVEIELKMDWQGGKQVRYFQVLNVIGQKD